MKNRSLRSSFQHAFEGLFYVMRAERNMKIHLGIMIFVVLVGIVFQINLGEWIVCIILFGLVIAAECLNTAVERTVDICSPNQSELAKVAKDSSAAFVLVLAMVAIIVGVIIFFPKVIELF